MNQPSSLRRTVLSVLAGTGLLVAGVLAAGSAAAGPAAVVPTLPTLTVPTVPTPPLPPPPKPPTVTTVVTTVAPPPLPPPPRPPTVTTVAPPPVPRPPTVTTTAPPPRPAPTPPPVPTVPRVAQAPSPSVPTPAPVSSQRAAAPAAAVPSVPAVSGQPAARSTSAAPTYQSQPAFQSQPSNQSGGPPPGPASGVWVLQTSSASSSTAPGEYPRVRLTKLRPSRARFANRGKKKATTVISFRLSRPVQILLVVKGPGPSCERVGRGQIAGRAGLNRVRFDGTVRNKPLKPGTYRLDARLRAGGRLLASSYVTIIDPQKPFKRYVRPDCSPAKPAAPREPGSGLSEVVTFTEIPAAAQPAQRKASEPAKPKEQDTLKQVLGERTPLEASGVPIAVTGDGASRSLLELVLILSVIGLLIALSAAIYVSVRRGRPLI